MNELFSVSFLERKMAQWPLALIINLDRRPDRWNRMLATAARWRFHPWHISAIDGQDLRTTPDLISEDLVTTCWNTSINCLFDTRCVKNAVVPLTPSERACAMSHWMIWKAIDMLHFGDDRQLEVPDMISQRIQSMVGLLTFYRSIHDNALKDFYLICEDDMQIHMNPISSLSKKNAFAYTHTLFQELSYIIQKLPSTVDICYLGGAMPRKSSAFKKVPLKRMFVRVNYIWGLHAYLMRGSSVRKVLEYLPINMPVDNFLASLAFNRSIEVMSPPFHRPSGMNDLTCPIVCFVFCVCLDCSVDEAHRRAVNHGRKES